MSIKQKPKLTQNERKRIEEIQQRTNNQKKGIKSAQDSVPYLQMYVDGVCKVTDTLYTKTIEFEDINYKIAQSEDKRAIFEGWCDFLNYFDNTIKFQLSYVNSTSKNHEIMESISIEHQDDGFDHIRKEYEDMLHSKLLLGNNGLKKSKYITFGIEEKKLKTAKLRLERIENDIRNNLKRIGVRSSSLDGKERLKLCHEILSMDGKNSFLFDWSWLAPSGLSTKDYIVPSSFEFKERQRFQTGDKIGTTLFLQIGASELNDRFLSDLLEADSNLVITMHMEAISNDEAIKTLKRKLTDLQRMKIEEQKKAVRSGYDMDILPPDLTTYGHEAVNFLKELQERNERMFLVTITITTAHTKKRKLENVLLQLNGIVNKHNCKLISLDYQQEQGFMSSLPLGNNLVPIQRTLTTSATAVFIPFTTQELFQRGKEALYYGVNAISNNLIMVDRKKLKNPNGLILGTPGSGKSFAAKREISDIIHFTRDDIIVCDPEGEYHPLVMQYGGQVIKISPVSSQYINPMDINNNYSDDDNPLALKSDFILSLCELIIGGKEGLSPVEKSIIDRCVALVYREYLMNPSPEKMPILEDLYDELGKQGEIEAKRVRSALEIYVKGSLNVFNHRTNVDIENRIVCFDIKELGNQLKKLGMLIVQDQVWNRVTKNRAEKKYTRYYMDEFHLLLKEEQTAMYSVEIWKRFRKWGGIPTAITQNVKDLLASRDIENIFENSDYIYMLNQASGDREILAKHLKISEHQLPFVTSSGVGEGLLFYGDIIIPFIDKLDSKTMLYQLITTKLMETKDKLDE